MGPGHRLAGYKEKANQKLDQERAGRAARLAAELALKSPETETTVHLRRQAHHGYPGTFLRDVGEVLAQNGQLELDLPASEAASKVPTSFGYGNRPVMYWSENFIAFVLRRAVSANVVPLVQPLPAGSLAQAA